MARILYLTQSYSVHDWRFLAKLAASPHEIWYQPCVEPAFKTETRAVPERVHVCTPLDPGRKTFSMTRIPKMMGALKKQIAEIKPDLIHAGSVPTGGLLAAAAGFHPTLIMSWGSDVLVQAKKNFMQRFIAQYTLNRADMALGDCEAVGESIRTLSTLKTSQIVSLPWGIQLNDFSNVSPHPVRATLGWENCTVLIATRGFEPIHSPLVLLEAFAVTLQKFPDTRLLMLGTGSLEMKAKAFVRARGLEGKVHFTSQVPNAELPSYFKASDVYISGTLSDGTSISLLEAMASGLPAIVVDAYGNKEWVNPKINGWRYEPGSVQALTETLDSALSNKHKFAEIGKTNQQRAARDADWDHNFKRLLDAYTQLLGGQAS